MDTMPENKLLISMAVPMMLSSEIACALFGLFGLPARGITSAAVALSVIFLYRIYQKVIKLL